MKKILCLAFFMAAFASFSFAQSPLGDGGKQLNLGLGIDDGSGTPLHAGVDFGLSDKFTIGIEGAIDFDNYFAVGGTANYHFDDVFSLPPEWNVYAGLGLGVISFNEGDDTVDLDLGAQFGARYFFSQNVGVNLELGGGTEISQGKLGVSIIL